MNTTVQRKKVHPLETDDEQGRSHPWRKAGAGAQPPQSSLPGQVVLVLQGGGALGAYQVGVYEALHDAGIEPDWVIGTSIGAINAALIAGNARSNTGIDRLNAFWRACGDSRPRSPARFDWLGMGNLDRQHELP